MKTTKVVVSFSELEKGASFQVLDMLGLLLLVFHLFSGLENRRRGIRRGSIGVEEILLYAFSPVQTPLLFPIQS